MHKKYNILFLLVACIFTACTPRAVREAQCVVAQADSLRAAGGMYSDSMQMAQAYKTLGSLSLFNFHFSTSYAHACYHYGRILREKENPVEAMQCFINATHSRTRDYHILGRVYSNMGEIAHLASEFPLSYDMFERSADMFLQSGDSIANYYALYRMAFELAEQGNKEETHQLLHDIEESCDVESVLALNNLTRATLYKVTEQYDSAILYAQEAQLYDMSYVDASLLMAQSYSCLGEKDSAVYYANIVLDNSNKLFHINNALYILTNDDDSKDKYMIRTFAANRADIQKIIEIRQGKLSQAVQLLQQDINRRPNMAWLYAVIGTLFTVGCVIGIYVQRKRKKQELYSQKLEGLKQATSAIQEKHEMMAERYIMEQKRIFDEVNEKCRLIRNNPDFTEALKWKDFNQMCQIIDQQFYLLASKLRDLNVLNEKELRLCILVLFGLSRAEMSNVIPYALNSVGKLKDDTAKLLGTTGKNLREFLLNMIVEG